MVKMKGKTDILCLVGLLRCKNVKIRKGKEQNKRMKATHTQKNGNMQRVERKFDFLQNGFHTKARRNGD